MRVILGPHFGQKQTRGARNISENGSFISTPSAKWLYLFTGYLSRFIATAVPSS